MRRALAFFLITSGFWAGAAPAAPAFSRDVLSPSDSFPAIPGVSGFGHPAGDDAAGNPGVTAPLVPTPKPAPQPAPPVTEAARLDDLFGRLAHAADAGEADALAGNIQQLWLHSGSDTADLLMVRAVTALGKGESKVASALLDKVIALDPGWAEAWNKRATLRFLKGDDVGSMEDIAEVLAREPRHFGALSGMAAILHRSGMDKEALALVRRTEAIYPHNADLEKLEAELSLKVEGRPI